MESDIFLILLSSTHHCLSDYELCVSSYWAVSGCPEAENMLTGIRTLGMFEVLGQPQGIFLGRLREKACAFNLAFVAGFAR